jgi:hypothetical protein
VGGFRVSVVGGISAGFYFFSFSAVQDATNVRQLPTLTITKYTKPRPQTLQEDLNSYAQGGEEPAYYTTSTMSCCSQSRRWRRSLFETNWPNSSIASDFEAPNQGIVAVNASRSPHGYRRHLHNVWRPIRTREQAPKELAGGGPGEGCVH